MEGIQPALRVRWTKMGRVAGDGHVGAVRLPRAKLVRRRRCHHLRFNADISAWDTSQVTNMDTCSVTPPRSTKTSDRGIPRRSRAWRSCSWRRRVQPRHRIVEYRAGHEHVGHVRWCNCLECKVHKLRLRQLPLCVQRVHVVRELSRSIRWSSHRLGAQRERVRCQRSHR